MKASQTPPRPDAAAKPSRRGFFVGAAAAGAALGAVAVLPRAGGPGAAAEAAVPEPAPDRGGGYHLSEHVKKYYRTSAA